MDPFTIAFLGSQALSVANSAMTGGYRKEAAALNRKIAELNAMNAEHDAYESIRQGLSKKATYQNQVNDVIKSQDVLYAYADVDTSFGTAKSIQEQTKLNGMLNATDITNAAYAKALGYNRQALNYRIQGQMNEAAVINQANSDLTSKVISAGARTAFAWDKLDFSMGDSPENLSGYEFNERPSETAGLSLGAPQIGYY